MRIPDHNVWGDGDFTVFLLHGGYGSSEYWRPQVKCLLEQGYRVVAWDTPGYGFSPLPDAQYTIEYLAECFTALLEQVGSPGSANVILGHSMGGLIAPKVCILNPGRLSALIISATVESLGHTEPEYQQNFIAERIAPLDAGVKLRDAAPALIQMMMGPDSSGDAVELVKKVTANTPDLTFRAAIKAIVEYDGRETLKGLRLPTLCIAGEHDPVGRPDMMSDIAANIPNSEFSCINGAAHYAWAEYPDVFNGVLFEFLSRVLARE
jgi:3-oxoadipate enol-lactonase